MGLAVGQAAFGTEFFRPRSECTFSGRGLKRCPSQDLQNQSGDKGSSGRCDTPTLNPPEKLLRVRLKRNTERWGLPQASD